MKSGPKLTPEQRQEIRRRYRAGEKPAALASAFNIRKKSVWWLCHNRDKCQHAKCHKLDNETLTRLRRTVGILAVLAALVAGCAHHPSNGQVIGRRHSPARYNDYVSFYCAAFSSNGICAMNMPIYHHDYVPERWSLHLRNSKHTGWTDVTTNIFDRCSPGRHYPDCAF